MTAHRRTFCAVILLALLGASFAPACWAHKVQVFAYADQGRIYAEAYFADGSPVKQGTVILYNGKGEEIGKCITSDEGLCDVPLPDGVDEVKVVIDAGMGHRGEYVIRGDELK